MYIIFYTTSCTYCTVLHYTSIYVTSTITTDDDNNNKLLSIQLLLLMIKLILTI